MIDLKIGKFTHADAGQMSLYLTYAKEHLMEPGENDPAGIILCSDKDDAVVHYAMGHMPAKVFASRYLPDAESLRREVLETKHALEQRVPYEDYPMARFPWKPWHEGVKLRGDLLSGDLPLHLFAADLYEVMVLNRLIEGLKEGFKIV